MPKSQGAYMCKALEVQVFLYLYNYSAYLNDMYYTIICTATDNPTSICRNAVINFQLYVEDAELNFDRESLDLISYWLKLTFIIILYFPESIDK